MHSVWGQMRSAAQIWGMHWKSLRNVRNILSSIPLTHAEKIRLSWIIHGNWHCAHILPITHPNCRFSEKISLVRRLSSPRQKSSVGTSPWKNRNIRAADGINPWKIWRAYWKCCKCWECWNECWKMLGNAGNAVIMSVLPRKIICPSQNSWTGTNPAPHSQMCRSTPVHTWDCHLNREWWNKIWDRQDRNLNFLRHDNVP